MNHAIADNNGISIKDFKKKNKFLCYQVQPFDMLL